MQAAEERIAALKAEGAQTSLGVREKDEILRAMEEMQQLTAETDQLSLQLKRRVL